MRIDAIYDRRSIRKYKPEIPDREIIAKVLDAARVAPSARNRQPWKYLVYTGEAKERILSTMQFALMSRGVVNSADAQMRQVIAGAVHTLRIMKNAPVVIFVVNPEGDIVYFTLPVAFWLRFFVLPGGTISVPLRDYMIIGLPLSGVYLFTFASFVCGSSPSSFT